MKMNCQTIFPRLSLGLVLLLFSFPAFSQGNVPQKSRQLVNDYANLLSPGQRNRLEHKLVAYDDSTSTQIAVFTEASLNGGDAFQRSLDIAEDWGIGRSGKDNGVLIYVALEERSIFIQTGYGMEGILPDAVAKRIINQVIKPFFRQEQYYEGLDRATDVIIKLASGTYKGEPLEDAKPGIPIGLIIFLVIFLLIWLSSRSGPGDGGYYGGGKYGRGRGGWIILGPGSGGGWSGGGGGGGFGGGGFGGGGAGGSW